jgi:hypothetical protein
MYIDVGTLYFLAIPAAALSALVFGAPIALYTPVSPWRISGKPYCFLGGLKAKVDQ